MYGAGERRDCELYYMKRVYRTFLEIKGVKSLETIEDPELAAYVVANHPRFFALAAKYGSPVDIVSVTNEGTNIASSSVKVTLESCCTKTLGKTLKKKLLTSMTIDALKSMCAMLFKENKLNIQLVYKEEGYDEDYDLDED